MACQVHHLFRSGCKLSLSKLPAQLLIRNDIPAQIRPLLEQQIGNQAAKDNLSGRVEVGPVTLDVVVQVGILLANGVDVVGARRVEVEIVDLEILGDCDGGVPPLAEVLDDVASAKGTACERRDDDLVRQYMHIPTRLPSGILTGVPPAVLTSLTSPARLFEYSSRVNLFWSLCPNWIVTTDS